MRYTTILLLLINQIVYSQKDTSNYFVVKANYQYGSVLPTNDFVRGKNEESSPIDRFQAFSLQVGKQTTGQKTWEQNFGYPTWGIGVYVGDFFNPEEIGNPIAVYGFFEAPFKRWNKFSINYNLGFGLTFNWKKFDPYKNSYNIAIGAGESVYMYAGANFAYQFSNRINLSLGGGFTHFSNGALKKPNFGINTLSPKITLTYNLNKEEVKFQHRDKPIFKKYSEFNFAFFGGAKNVLLSDNSGADIIQKFEGVFYPVYGISFLYNRSISYKSKFGIGTDFSYDGSINAQVAIQNGEVEEIDGPFFERTQLSTFLSYELVVHKVSVVIQPGVYVYRKKFTNQTPIFYQRLGLKYNFYKNIFASVAIRAYNFKVSDFIEWSIGYRLKK